MIIKDVGILKSIGATNSNIMTLFAMEGALIGVIGTALGAALGLGAMLSAAAIGWDRIILNLLMLP